MKRVGIAGFLHESNTYVPVPTTRQNFEKCSYTRGKELLERWQGSNHELGGFLKGAATHSFCPVPLLATYAIPSGVISSSAFDEIVGQMIHLLKEALPLDGILVALHGATVTENFRDADGEIVTRLRQIVGPDVPIIQTLDLHANVSPRMIANTNATVIYRSNPHLDQWQRGLEAAALMARTLGGEIHPVQALESSPLLINISKQHTHKPPAQQLYEDAMETMKWSGVLSASVAMGFYYADAEEMGTSFLAVVDKDKELAVKVARWMARRAWDRRQEFLGELVSPAEAVRHASQSPAESIVLMDVGDNVGGGSSGDSTILLEEILKQGVPNALVVLCDPEAVSHCVQAGVKQTVEIAVGAKTDSLHGKPLNVKGKVRLISDGMFVENQVRHGGWGINDQGVTAVVETDQRHTVVLTSLRMAPMSLE